MTPQMIRALSFFMIAMFFKESFDLADMKRCKNVSSLFVMIFALRFLFLVYRQWVYLGQFMNIDDILESNYDVMIIKQGDRINDLDTGKVYKNPEKLYVILDGQKVIGRYTQDELKKLKNIGVVK